MAGAKNMPDPWNIVFRNMLEQINAWGVWTPHALICSKSNQRPLHAPCTPQEEAAARTCEGTWLGSEVTTQVKLVSDQLTIALTIVSRCNSGWLRGRRV